jgi:hypothetical protein
VRHHGATSSMPLRPPPPPPPAAAATSPSCGFVNVVVNYPRGCHDKWQWCGGTFFLPTFAGRAASSSVHLNDNQGYVFAPSHATMGGLWGEEDEGRGRTATGGVERRDKRCPMGMDEGAASTLAAQMTARGGAVRGGMMCCGAVAVAAGMQQLWQQCHLGPFSTLSRFVDKSKFYLFIYY